MALLHWMEGKEEFKDVHFYPGKGCGNLKEKLGEERVRELVEESKECSKRIRHKKFTIERCWKLMLNDLWIGGEDE